MKEAQMIFLMKIINKPMAILLSKNKMNSFQMIMKKKNRIQMKAMDIIIILHNNSPIKEESKQAHSRVKDKQYILKLKKKYMEYKIIMIKDINHKIKEGN